MEGGSSITFPPLMYLKSLSSSFKSTMPVISEPDPKLTRPREKPAQRLRHSLPIILSVAVLDFPI